MIRVLFMLLHLARVDDADGAVRHFVAHARVDLDHLRAMEDRESLFFKDFGRLDRVEAGRRPDGESAGGRADGGSRVESSLGMDTFAVGQQSLCHFAGVVVASVVEGHVGAVRDVVVGYVAGARKVGAASLDVQVGEEEDDAVREVVEADVVVKEFLAGSDHAHVVEVALVLELVHCLEGGYLHLNALEVEFGRLVGIHAAELRVSGVAEEERGAVSTTERKTHVRG